MCSLRALGFISILIGCFMIKYEILWTKTIESIRQQLPLVEGSIKYKAWISPIKLTFTCYFFNVTNPDEVMRGANPNFDEYGPITYNELYEKQIIDVDEELDEITYTTKVTYSFNKSLSVNTSKYDKVTILNPAYVGTITTLASLPPDFMNKYGNNIPKLFLNRSSIFLKARPTDILFDGTKVSCNLKKFPELNLICNTLKASPPPVLRESGKEDTYLLSLFQRMNATFRGPFSINRGVKNMSKLGDLTAYKGKKLQAIWNSDSCNTVRGTDSVTWAPLIEPLPFVSIFIPELCRTVEADYKDDVSILGITGARFVLNERVWSAKETECYCPLVRKQPSCLPKGLLDVSECQNIPAIVSEPHFLHADPQLLTYARGLNPNESVHGTYIVIEPLTGTPLSGQVKTQINIKLRKQPVKLLENVSEGYFPLLWCQHGNTVTLPVIASTYQNLRLVQVIRFLEKVPLITGIYMVLVSLLYLNFTKRRVKPTATPLAEAILISSNSQPNNITRRSQSQVRRQ